VLVRLQLALVLRAVVVEDLDLKAGRAGRILELTGGNAEEHATIAVHPDLPFDPKDKITIHLLGPQPSAAGLGLEDTVLHRPAALLAFFHLPFRPAVEVLAVKERHEIVGESRNGQGENEGNHNGAHGGSPEG